MVVGGDVANIGNEVAWWSYMRPNLVGDPGSGGRSSARWFNTDAFEVPAFGSFGNAGRGHVYSEAVTFFDFSLFKRIRMGRRTLGGGALRVLQHPQSGELRGARLDGALPDHGQGLQHGRSDAAGAVRAEDNILNLAPGPLPGRLQEA